MSTEHQPNRVRSHLGSRLEPFSPDPEFLRPRFVARAMEQLVFILGDSISIDYTQYLREQLCGFASVARKNEDGKYTDMTLSGANGGLIPRYTCMAKIRSAGTTPIAVKGVEWSRQECYGTWKATAA